MPPIQIAAPPGVVQPLHQQQRRGRQARHGVRGRRGGELGRGRPAAPAGGADEQRRECRGDGHLDQQAGDGELSSAVAASVTESRRVPTSTAVCKRPGGLAAAARPGAPGDCVYATAARGGAGAGRAGVPAMPGRTGGRSLRQVVRPVNDGQAEQSIVTPSGGSVRGVAPRWMLAVDSTASRCRGPAWRRCSSRRAGWRSAWPLWSGRVRGRWMRLLYCRWCRGGIWGRGPVLPCSAGWRQDGVGGGGAQEAAPAGRALPDRRSAGLGVRHGYGRFGAPGVFAGGVLARVRGARGQGGRGGGGTVRPSLLPESRSQLGRGSNWGFGRKPVSAAGLKHKSAVQRRNNRADRRTVVAFVFPCRLAAPAVQGFRVANRCLSSGKALRQPRCALRPPDRAFSRRARSR